MYLNWIDKILFHVKASGGSISRKNIEPLLMGGALSYDESIDRLKEMIDKKLILRVEDSKHSFKLSDEGNQQISYYFKSVIDLIEIVKIQIEKNLTKKEDIELKGGITGLYFTYKEMSMFRFHPGKGKEGVFLFVRLPNLIGESIDYKSNEIYISKKVLTQTTFLEDIINNHLKMIDDYYHEEV